MNITKKISNNIYLVRNNSGFGLLELVITLSLLGIILAISFSFLFFGSNTFSAGEQQTDVQQNARIVADFISKELRIAERVVIVDGHEDLEFIDIYESSGDYLLYYIYNKDGAVFYEIPDDTYELTQFIKEISGNIDFTLMFRKSESNSDIINFTLTAEEIDSGRSYALETEVLVLNLKDIEDESDGSGSAIFYQIPAPPDPAIRSILISPQSHIWSINGETSFDIEVWTINTPDNSKVIAGLSEEFPSDDPADSKYSEDYGEDFIENNYYKFVNCQVDSNLLFGFYRIRVAVSNDDSATDQSRFYYVEPYLAYEGLEPKTGNPHVGTVTLKTGGVPSGTEAITYKTEFSDDDYFDNVVIKLIDGNNNSIIPFEFNPSGPKVEADGEYGKLKFGIKVDPEYARKDLEMAVLIGKTEFGPFPFSKQDTLEPLSDLQVHLTDEMNENILSPQYNPDSGDFTRVFNIPINSGQESVWILTELDANFKEASITINDVAVIEGITKVSVSGLLDNKIDIVIDGTYTYTINVTQ